MPNSVDGGETDQFLACASRATRWPTPAARARTRIIPKPASSSATAPTCTAGQVTVIQNNIVLDQTMDLVRGDAAPDRGRCATCAA